MNKKKLILGIDTSNYKTSLSICDIEANVLADARKLLEVKQGERGLRQSNALFQHVENLPKVLEDLLIKPLGGCLPSDICAIAASVTPRPCEGSYMPCFNVGRSFGESMAKLLGVPFYRTTHQEGHIAAITNTISHCPNDFLALHLSGGTCELLKVRAVGSGYDIQIIGGSKDISYGQLLDRVGVALGMPFPSGEYMDDMAINIAKQGILAKSNKLKPIKVDDTYINLSGIETQSLRLIEASTSDENNMDFLVLEIFEKITKSLCKMCENAITKTGLDTVVFVGGVASSKYISKKCLDFANKKQFKFEFGKQEYSSDNAIGVALIGGKIYGNKANKSITTK